jgi:hypothetical protein
MAASYVRFKQGPQIRQYTTAEETQRICERVHDMDVSRQDNYQEVRMCENVCYIGVSYVHFKQGPKSRLLVVA